MIDTVIQDALNHNYCIHSMRIGLRVLDDIMCTPHAMLYPAHINIPREYDGMYRGIPFIIDPLLPYLLELIIKE